MVKVSVIMPSLNVAKYIRQCVESVMQQSLKDIEILCIDAGSTDGTLEILEDCAARDNRIRVIKSDVRSYGYQVNLGIKNATGRYVGIVETDDYINSNMYERLNELAETHQADIVKGDWNYVIPIRDEEMIMSASTFSKEDNVYGRVISMDDCPWIVLRDCMVWKGIYRREYLIESEVFFNESPGAAYQDYGFLPIVLSKAKRIYYTNEHLYNYRYGRPGCSSINPKVLMFAYQEWKRLYEGALDIFSFPYYEYLLERMLDAFVGEFDKGVAIQNYDYESEYIKPYYDWFVNVLTDVLAEYDLPCKKNEDKWRHIQLLLNNPKEYIHELEQKNQKNKVRQKEFLESIDSEDVVIFGCGNYGLRTYELVMNNDINVNAFCDNNSSLWGESVLNTPIIAPQEAVNQYGDSVYIVANKAHVNSIVNQLCECGISKEKIIVVQAACLAKM